MSDLPVTANQRLTVSDGENIGDGVGACKRCGTPFVPGAGRCATCQSFAVANEEHRRLPATRQHPAALRMSADELMAGIAADRGGDAELSTLERAYVRKLGDVEICIGILTEDIASRGLLTRGGKVRDVYDKLLAGLDRFDRYAQRIGIERRAKRIPTVDEVAALYSGPERK